MIITVVQLEYLFEYIEIFIRVLTLLTHKLRRAAGVEVVRAQEGKFIAQSQQHNVLVFRLLLKTTVLLAHSMCLH